MVNKDGQWRKNGAFEDLDNDTDRDPAQKKKLMAKMNKQRRSPTKQLPVVRFWITASKFRDVLVDYQKFNIELPTGESLVSRTQIPLILSWAMSIHKAQGQSRLTWVAVLTSALNYVTVDLNRVFERGQGAPVSKPVP